MCGICGFFYSHQQNYIAKETLYCMRDALAHRGPDDKGLYLDKNIGLGHRRLSILDLSKNGRQPMATADGRYQIVYNGEIYNFKELRHNLEAGGFTFKSKTDTEVLLYLYVSEGVAMLSKLNGMFAFAIWDSRERSLFMARDRLGIKPFWHTR